MSKRSNFKFLFLSFLLILIAGTAFLNLTEENIESLPSLTDDFVTEQQADHSQPISLLSLSDNYFRTSHFNTNRHSSRQLNRTLNGSNVSGDNNYHINSVYNSSEKELYINRRIYSDKIYFLYTLRRINI